jgi:hypothetical protein
MNWIKNRYDQLILAVVALAVLVFAGMVVEKSGRLPKQLSAAAVGLLPTPSGGPVIEGVFSVPAISAAISPACVKEGGQFASGPIRTATCFIESSKSQIPKS